MSSITFDGVGNLCRFLHYAKRNNSLETSFKGVLRELTAAELEQDKAKLPFLTSAMRGLTGMAAELQQYESQDLTCEGIDHDVTLLSHQGSALFQELKGVNSQTLPALVKKIQAAVKGRFQNPEEVDREITAEAARQEAQILNMKLCTGLIGFYQMVLQRPHLQYEIGNQNRNHQFILTFPKELLDLTRSFSDERAAVSQNQGKAALGYLASQAHSHQDKLRELCPRGSETESFIDALVALKGDKSAQNFFYERLRLVTRKLGGDTSVSLADFFNSKATEIGAALPPELQPNTKAVAAQIASSFQEHWDHGNGAFVHGIQGFYKNYDQLFGEGIRDGRTFTDINAYNPDLAYKPDVINKLKEFAKNVVDEFYRTGVLASEQQIVSPKGGIITIPIDNPMQRAFGTVGSIITYELAQHSRIQGRLFDLDVSEKQRLIPEFAKKIILFGIQKNTFQPDQITALCIKYSLSSDPDIAAAVREARESGMLRQGLTSPQVDLPSGLPKPDDDDCKKQ